MSILNTRIVITLCKNITIVCVFVLEVREIFVSLFFSIVFYYFSDFFFF